MIRFKTKGKVFSVGTMIYAVMHFGLKESGLDFYKRPTSLPFICYLCKK